MMEGYKGYWISGTALPGPPNTRNWKLLGNDLRDWRLGSVVEVVRIQDNSITFDFAGLAEWYGLEISRMFVDHCLPSSG